MTEGRAEGGGGDRAALEAQLGPPRAEISAVTERLITVIGQRRELAVRIGRVKARLGLPLLDPAREAEVVREAAVRARALGVDEEMTRDVIWRIIASARADQGDSPPGWPD